ncbi:MAG: hypothetical protein Q9157_007824 [Trypethelium eluteriae]
MDTSYTSLSSSEREKNDPSLSHTTTYLLTKDDNAPIKVTQRPQLLSRTSSRVASVLEYVHRSWTWYLTSHILSFLWLAPIVALLALNFSHYIIGASAFCPAGHCESNVLGSLFPDGVKSQAELDKRDHNLLGALQFVSKAIEVWFTFIATSLVFDVVMILARSPRGLPLGFLLTHLQFSDLRNVANPLLWTSARTPGMEHKRGQNMVFRVFVALAIFLTILTNLMGPSIAALLLPALQSVPIFNQAQQQYQAISSDKPPSGDEVFLGSCGSADLSASQYSCTASAYGPSLDSIAAFVDSSWQEALASGVIEIPLIQEDAVTFQFNVSARSDIIWTPSRQVLRNISTDLDFVYSTIEGTNVSLGTDFNSTALMPDYQLSVLNRSLSTMIQRRGPSLGLASSIGCGAGELLEINGISSSSDQTVRCLTGRPVFYDDGNSSIYTKCFRAGQGWNETNKLYEFSLPPISNNATTESFSAGRTAVSVYFSDKAVYFNETTDFGSGIAACYSDSRANNGQSAASCDWDKIFNTDMPGFLQNSSNSVLNTEYYLASAASTKSPLRVYCDATAILNFTTYSIDPTLTANPALTVQVAGFPDGAANGSNVVLDPSWLLAAWSVNPNSTVSSNRSMTFNLQRNIQSWSNVNLTNDIWNNFTYSNNQNEFTDLNYAPLLQALTMINYDFTNITDPTGVKCSGDSSILCSTIVVQVWAYGINTRTAILGVVVSILGILVVFARLILGIIYRSKPECSEFELLVGALEHQNQGEFEGLHHEKDEGRVRYQILDGSDGKPLFILKKSV